MKEALRRHEALWPGHDYLRARPGFDQEYFVRVCRRLQQTHDGLHPARALTYVKQGGTAPNAGTAAYTPPRGPGILEAKLANLLDFTNDDARYPLDPLLKMTVGHLQFEAIHLTGKASTPAAIHRLIAVRGHPPGSRRQRPHGAGAQHSLPHPQGVAGLPHPVSEQVHRGP
ncbi:hypothetical protein GCM10027422_43310 [Hymenobacter arcticus]